MCTAEQVYDKVSTSRRLDSMGKRLYFNSANYQRFLISSFNSFNQQVLSKHRLLQGKGPTHTHTHNMPRLIPIGLVF